MTSDFESALRAISDSIETSLTTMVTDGTVEEVIFGTKTRGTINYPNLQFKFDIMKIDMTTMGSIGNIEAWKVPVRIAAIVKEVNDPQDGMITAAGIISTARNLLLVDRQLGIPTVVRKVDSKEIEIIPYPLNKKKTLYGAGTILEVLFIITNTA